VTDFFTTTEDIELERAKELSLQEAKKQPQNTDSWFKVWKDTDIENIRKGIV